MTEIARSKASLGFFGDGLDPAEVTALLRAQPTQRYRKGDNASAPGRTGSWLLGAEEREPADLNAQIRDLLSDLNDDPAVWRDLTTRFSARMFCGLFMQSENEGLELEPQTLTELGSRGLLLSLDIYDSSPD